MGEVLGAGAQARCETFNGQEVRNLARLAELVDSCQDKYMRFGLEGGKLVILDRCLFRASVQFAGSLYVKSCTVIV